MERRLTAAGQATLLTCLETELDNLRAAIESARSLDVPTPYLRLVSALAPFWATRGLASEGGGHARAALERSVGRPVPERARALSAAARLAIKRRDWKEARCFGEESLELFRRLGDTAGQADACYFLGLAAHMAVQVGESDAGSEARARFSQSLCLSEAAGAGPTRALALLQLARAAQQQGKCDRAECLGHAARGIGCRERLR